MRIRIGDYKKEYGKLKKETRHKKETHGRKEVRTQIKKGGE